MNREQVVMNIPEGNYSFSVNDAIGLVKIAESAVSYIRCKIDELGIKDEQHIAAYRTVLVEMIKADEYAQKIMKEVEEMIDADEYLQKIKKESEKEE